MNAARVLLALCVVLVPIGMHAQRETLDAAKALYASGAYEEALARLATAQGADIIDEADQYRALCLLALGRADESERSLEQLVTRRPLLRLSERDVSPRLVTAFRAVRKRVLPAAMREMYGSAKASFDQKRYGTAAAELKDLLTLFADEDVDRSAPALEDLRLLAEGFLRLAENELAIAAKAADARAREAALGDPNLFSAADEDVTPPVELARPLPAWRPANPLLASREHRGLLRLVIDEHGHVESATLLDSVAPGYDPLLLAEARKWKFQPALRNGAPVRYLRELPIVLAPR